MAQVCEFMLIKGPLACFLQTPEGMVLGVAVAVIGGFLLLFKRKKPGATFEPGNLNDHVYDTLHAAIQKHGDETNVALRKGLNEIGVVRKMEKMFTKAPAMVDADQRDVKSADNVDVEDTLEFEGVDSLFPDDIVEREKDVREDGEFSDPDFNDEQEKYIDGRRMYYRMIVRDRGVFKKWLSSIPGVRKRYEDVYVIPAAFLVRRDMIEVLEDVEFIKIMGIEVAKYTGIDVQLEIAYLKTMEDMMDRVSEYWIKKLNFLDRNYSKKAGMEDITSENIREYQEVKNRREEEEVMD